MSVFLSTFCRPIRSQYVSVPPPLIGRMSDGRNISTTEDPGEELLTETDRYLQGSDQDKDKDKDKDQDQDQDKDQDQEQDQAQDQDKDKDQEFHNIAHSEGGAVLIDRTNTSDHLTQQTTA
ncbi:hypothetical protein F2P81_019744 [Scophthalmus maximus]|uniref:Uncharacterized protein n=1 Tax=Scophthalmus maximus TaxID=52904 RepID=A0A6A4S6E4_SCOMX|nr:hypothetical protein F2P81_019744 [Scophthalmus maximus]